MSLKWEVQKKVLGSWTALVIYLSTYVCSCSYSNSPHTLLFDILTPLVIIWGKTALPLFRVESPMSGRI